VLLRAITEVAAPPFGEGERSAFVAGLWRAAGADVVVDDLGNLRAEPAGGVGPRVMLCAHLDSVFPAGTDVRVREESPERWAAPGVSDDAPGLAVVTLLLEDALAGRFEGPRLVIAASVGEEGLGDLRGARRLVADAAGSLDVFIAVDGGLGQIVTGGVGSRRLEVAFRARGGHSWSDRGSPSAVHALGDAIHDITRIEVPSDPPCSLNVGVVQGGTSVNAIAEGAVMTIDVRSVKPDALALLEERIRERVASVARRHRVEVAVRTVGDRPAGATAGESLIAAARAALAHVGIDVRAGFSSTDANAAIAAGIPAIGFGVARGGDAHRESEWVDPTSLAIGDRALRYLLRELAS
jgi:tripeptide aminopeptidase